MRILVETQCGRRVVRCHHLGNGDVQDIIPFLHSQSAGGQSANGIAGFLKTDDAIMRAEAQRRRKILVQIQQIAMPQLDEVPDDQFDALFVIDADRRIESLAGGIDADDGDFCGAETNTASALLRTGSFSKNASRASNPSIG